MTDRKAKAKATATAKTNTEVLRFAQDDGGFGWCGREHKQRQAGRQAEDFGEALVEADVFVPEGGVCGDVVAHHGDAVGVGEVDDVDAEFAEPKLAAGEVDALAEDDGAEAELADEAAAIPAGGERGDHDEVAVGALAAGVAEGVGLTVEAGVGLLDAAVVAPADEGAVGAEDGCADGETAFGEAEAGFVEGDAEHGGVVGGGGCGHDVIRIQGGRDAGPRCAGDGGDEREGWRIGVK